MRDDHGLAGLANTARLPDQLRHRACGGFLAGTGRESCGEMASFL